MAIVQALLAVLMRSMGSILNTTFGWATLMLFGRIPSNRKTPLSVISFGSVLWIIAFLGAIHPPIASFLIFFITIPEAMQPWVRLILIVLALVLPLVVGAVAMRLHPHSGPRRVGEWVSGLLRGYPYTLGFALTLAMLTLLVPLAKMRDAIHHWTSIHIPMIVGSEHYERVVDTLQQALARRDLPTTRGKASWVLRFPTRVLSLFARSSVESLVSDRLITLRAKDLEILLHPSDLVVSGRPEETARASAVLLETLLYTPAHLTWDKEGNDLEDRLQGILREAKSSGAPTLTSAFDKLQAVEADLRRSHLPFEELEKIFRIKLQVETEVLRAARASMA